MLVRIHFGRCGKEIDDVICVLVADFERIRVVMLSPVLVGKRRLEGGVRGSGCVLGRRG